LLLAVNYLSAGQTDNDRQQKPQPKIGLQKNNVFCSCHVSHFATFRKTSSLGKKSPLRLPSLNPAVINPPVSYNVNFSKIGKIVNIIHPFED
jgi:hypothetical protein